MRACMTSRLPVHMWPRAEFLVMIRRRLSVCGLKLVVAQVSMILQNVLRHSSFDGIFKTCLVGFTEIDSNLSVFTGITQISALDTESKETIKIAFQDKFYGGQVIDERRVMSPLLHLARQDMRSFDNFMLHSFSIATPHCISIPPLCTRWSCAVTIRCPPPPIPRG